jgi:hypothetical protein
MQAVFKFRGEMQIALTAPKAESSVQSAYIIGMKKGGSTLLAQIMRDLAPLSPRTLFEYPKLAFDQGMPESTAIEDVSNILTQPGYVFGVFRWLPEADLFDLNAMLRADSPRAARCLLLLRDPRDALVSLYFSDAASHPIPKSGPLKEVYEDARARLVNVPIDDYVLELAPIFLRHYYRTMQLLALPELTLLRYEDIVYDKLRLVRATADVMEAHADEATLVQIAEKYARIPSNETPAAHLRQAHPGDYTRKLAPATIEKLNGMFAPVLTTFGYDQPGLRESATAGDQKDIRHTPQPEGIKADLIVIGTSNSILRGGWVDGLRDGVQGEVRNLSIGASASAFVLWQLLDADLPSDNIPSIFMLDTAVNDESFIGAERYQIAWWHYYMGHILDALPADRTCITGFSTQKNFTQVSKPTILLEEMCRERGHLFVSLRRIMVASLRIAKSKVEQRDENNIFEDPGHFHRHLARHFGGWISRNLPLDPTPRATPKKALAKAGFKTLTPQSHAGIAETRRSSLRAEKTIRFGIGQSFHIEGPCILHGLCVDASNTRAVLDIDVPDGANQSIELGYNENSDRMQVKYVHFQKPVVVGPQGTTVSIATKPAHAFSRGIHSRSQDGPMTGMRLLSFLAGPVIDTPPEPDMPTNVEPSVPTEFEKEAIRHSGIITALIDPPELQRYPRSFIEL